MWDMYILHCTPATLLSAPNQALTYVVDTDKRNRREHAPPQLCCLLLAERQHGSCLELPLPAARVAGCHRGTACKTPATARAVATARPVPGAMCSNASLSPRANEVPTKPTAVGSGTRTTGRLPSSLVVWSCSCGLCAGGGGLARAGLQSLAHDNWTRVPLLRPTNTCISVTRTIFSCCVCAGKMLHTCRHKVDTYCLPV